MTTTIMATPDDGWPGLRAEEHDFDDMYPPPLPSSVTRNAEVEPRDEDDQDPSDGDWID
jgi:hypothetical protein